MFIFYKGDTMDNCCSPVMKLVCKVSMFLSSLAAIHAGLLATGYDVIGSMRLHEYARPIGYIFGIAGLISLIMLIMWCTKSRAACANCNCDSKGSGSSYK